MTFGYGFLALALAICAVGVTQGRPAVYDSPAPVDESICTLTAPAPHHNPSALCCDACMHPYLLTTTRTKQTVFTSSGFEKWYADYQISVTEMINLLDTGFVGSRAPWASGNSSVGAKDSSGAAALAEFESFAASLDAGPCARPPGGGEARPEAGMVHDPGRVPIDSVGSGASAASTTETRTTSASGPGGKVSVTASDSTRARRSDMFKFLTRLTNIGIETYVKETQVETNEICGRCITMDECAAINGRVENWHHRCFAPY